MRWWKGSLLHLVLVLLILGNNIISLSPNLTILPQKLCWYVKKFCFRSTNVTVMLPMACFGVLFQKLCPYFIHLLKRFLREDSAKLTATDLAFGRWWKDFQTHAEIYLSMKWVLVLFFTATPTPSLDSWTIAWSFVMPWHCLCGYRPLSCTTADTWQPSAWRAQGHSEQLLFFPCKLP
jgi:hypothetical protein